MAYGSFHAIITRFSGSTSARLDLDPAGLRALTLGQRKFEYAVLHQGSDLLVVDILVQFELPKVVSDIVLSVERRQLLISLGRHGTSDSKNPLLVQGGGS